MTKALIIGGGIAGPVTAMALQRAGIDSVIYESRTPGETAGGAFLTVAVNGLDALRAIDAHGSVLAAGFPSRTIELRSGKGGKRLGEVPLGGELPDGTATHTMKRADLYQALLAEAWDRGIPIEYGKRLHNAAPTPAGGVVAWFEDGTQASGDLLVGADGIYSRTRRIIDPGAPAPRYTGLGNIGGFCRRASVTGEPGKYVMIFGRRAFFGYVLSPSGEVWWFANPPSPELGRAELASLGSEQWKERLIALFAEDAGPAAQIIGSTDALLIGGNQYDMPRVPRWWRGPMIAIGDAAHAASPTSGQGASLAMEDAVTLAQCLRDLPDTESAFVAYQQIRQPRVERIVAWAARMNSNKAPGAVGRALRDLVLPVILKRQGSADAQRWIFDHHVEWDARIPLVRAA